MEKIIRVNATTGTYPIHIGQRLLSKVGKYMREEFSQVKQVFVVTNSTIAPLYADTVLHGLEEVGIQGVLGIIPDGEEYKTLATASDLYDQLIAAQMDRHSFVLSLGGGVVGDIAGFVAATYMRGLPFAQLPTSLLAQVDSSVGGKVAVNHPVGKNLIGAFYQPQFVWMDLDTLATLPREELIAGMAEVIKTAVLVGERFFSWLEEHVAEGLALNFAKLADLIGASCRFKAEIVEQDEREKSIRAILNFGHTVGHALEAVTHYQRYRHGEAVAIGMVVACRLAEEMSILSSDITQRLIALLNQTGLPTKMPEDIEPEAILEAIQQDKKAVRGKVPFILPTELGNVKVVDDWKAVDLVGMLKV